MAENYLLYTDDLSPTEKTLTVFRVRIHVLLICSHRGIFLIYARSFSVRGVPVRPLSSVAAGSLEDRV